MANGQILVGRTPLRLISIAWGVAYVNDFLELCLPALLAPGNLPVLAENFNTEIVFLTEEKFFDAIRKHPAYCRASQLCRVELRSVDDLVASGRGSYGMSLTYAFFRGFEELGPAMRDYYLVFIHADFILADGSYRNLVRHLLAGERLVFSPSYCAISEDARPQLLASRNRTEPVLSVPNRRLASIALRHRHYTVRAKTANQRFYHLDTTDQFYWAVDESTLLGRQHPVALVAMRPERALSLDEVGALWDYGLVADFFDDMKFVVLGDSDEFLMLELRERDRCQNELHLGWPDEKVIAAGLAKFITKYIVELGRAHLVLHSKDLPAELEQSQREMDEYIKTVYQQLPGEPPDHANHFQWNYHYLRFHQIRSQYLADKATASGKADQEEAQPRSPATESEQQVSKLFGELQAKLPVGVDAPTTVTLLRSLASRLVDVEMGCTTLAKDIGARVHGDQPGTRSDCAETALSFEKRLCDLANFLEEARQIFQNIYELRVADLQKVKHLTGVLGSTKSSPMLAAELPRTGLHRISAAIFGSAPEYKLWHWMRAPLELALTTVRRDSAHSKNILLLRSGFGFFDFCGREKRSLVALPNHSFQHSPMLRHLVPLETEFDYCILEADIWDLPKFGAIFHEVRPLMRPGGKMLAFFWNPTLSSVNKDDTNVIWNAFPVCGPARVAYVGSWAARCAIAVRLRTTKFLQETCHISDSIAAGVGLFAATLFAAIASLIERQKTFDNARAHQVVPAAVIVEIQVG